MRVLHDEGGIVLILGDAREAVAVFPWAVMITDPPYGIAHVSGQVRPGTAWAGKEIAGDEDVNLRDDVLSHLNGRPAAVFGTWKRPRPDGVRALLTWDKGENCGMGDLTCPWKPNTEEVYILGPGWFGYRGSSVLSYSVGSTQAAGRTHPTEKPVTLIEHLILKAPPGLIIDPFCGTGATLVAAKNLGRQCVGIEIDPDYAAIAADRLRQGVLPGLGV